MMTLTISLLFSSTLLLSAQEPDTSWVSEELGLSVTMRDGKQLSGDLYLPAKKGRYPCVLIQTPYNKKRLRKAFQGKLENAKGTSTVGRGAISDILVLKDREHYAYLVMDWRGFFASKKAARGVRRVGAVRGKDGYDTVEWIAKQPWSNGKVGTWGGSALGKIQFQTAIEQPPHLVCAVPMIASMGITYDQYFEGGVPLDAHLKILDFLGFGLRQRVLANPEPDSLIWRLAKKASYKPQKVQVPCLMITGWWDNYPDAVIATFEDLVAKGGEDCRKHSRLLIGPWDHVGIGLRKQGVLDFPKAEHVSGLAAKAFLDLHLRGIGKEVPERVRYFDSGSREWKSCESWSAEPRRDRFYVLFSRGLIWEVIDVFQDQGTRSYRYDPKKPLPTLGGRNLPPLPHGPRMQNALLERKDVLVWKTDVLAKPVDLDGRATLEFSFECNRVDVDFVALLCDVDEKGRYVLLAEIAQRASLTGPRRKLLDPKKPHSMEITFPSHAHRFAKGHRIALLLSSGNSPRYQPNPHDGKALWKAKGSLDVSVKILAGQDRAGTKLAAILNPTLPCSLRLPKRQER